MRRMKPKVIDRDPESVARGNRIWWLRCEAQMSQKEVAEKAGLSVPSICKLENGDYKSSTLRTLTKIAKAFGVSISYLLGESTDAK